MARSVLIVDDHPEFRAVARQLLEEAGYSVIGEAGGVASALDALTGLMPDVVLLDIQLPDGSGLDLAELLAERETGPSVVLISSREAEDYGERIVDCGARGFIPKSRLSGAELATLLQ